MTAAEAIAYIESSGWSNTRLGLERTKELLQRLGNPQKKLKFIHVAGSNGKGSTCAMLDSILRCAGYCVGLYTSPYIETFGERMRVDGENITDEMLADITETVKEISDTMADHPSQFELVTAIAMEYFYRKNCDIVVLEVGLGGAMDSTNAIDAPELAVITNIGLEHTEYLGNTLEEIASAKGGIIKPATECICYESASEVTKTISGICADKEVPCAFVKASEAHILSQSLKGQKFLWRNMPYGIPLLGPHQIQNAAVVLNCIEALRKKGWRIPDTAVKKGLNTVSWPARMEVLGSRPLFILDGGHNPQCANALAESISLLLPGRKLVFLVGVLADKDYRQVMQTLMPFAESFICVTPESPRALSAAALAEYLHESGYSATVCEDIPQGISAALNTAGEFGSVVAFGSLYMAGAIRTRFGSIYRNWLRKQKIAYRNSLSDEVREEYSRQIAEKIKRLPEYKCAKNVLLYRAAGGEVSLCELKDDTKRFAYPLCTSKTEMAALVPENDKAWQSGYCGIIEPIREKSEELLPQQLDLIICPCTAFDEECNRMGMGGGFYDRYLPQCKNAAVIAVAFERQKTDRLPTEPWDVKMIAVVTEKNIYRSH